MSTFSEKSSTVSEKLSPFSEKLSTFSEKLSTFSEKLSTLSLETRQIGIGFYTISRSSTDPNILYISHKSSKIKFLVHENGVIISDDHIDESPSKSSALTIQSNRGGLTLPRLTNNEMKLMTNPIPGTIIFNITLDKMLCYSQLSGWI